MRYWSYVRNSRYTHVIKKGKKGKKIISSAAPILQTASLVTGSMVKEPPA